MLLAESRRQRLARRQLLLRQKPLAGIHRLEGLQRHNRLTKHNAMHTCASRRFLWHPNSAILGNQLVN